MKQNPKFIIGIDEAGRGPLAGPVSVGAVLVPRDFDFSVFSKVADSKKMTEKARGETYKEVRTLARKGGIHFSVALISASVIDRVGISKAVARGIEQILKKLDVAPSEVEVRLDGLLHAPPEYVFQKTIIKGDVTEPAISLASIMAKVTRDRWMVRTSKKYPAYSFHVHKGYGTALHQQAIRSVGLLKLHRKSFCKKFVKNPAPRAQGVLGAEPGVLC